MNSNFQERIIAILQGSPNGLTSNEIAQRLGATTGNISSRLSKLAAYGIITIVRCLPLVDRRREYCRSCVDRRVIDAVLSSISSTLAGCACALSHRYGGLRVIIRHARRFDY